jgi:hypothetical protein
MVVLLDIVAYLALEYIYFGYQYSLKFRRIVMTEKKSFFFEEELCSTGCPKCWLCVEIRLVIIFMG